MANRKEPPEDTELKAPLWVVTYSDLISLLVTFFVLLFTFSTMESEPLRRVRGSLIGAFGAVAEPGRQARPAIAPRPVPQDAKTDLRGVKEPPERKELEVDEFVRKFQSGFDVPIEVQGDGIRIRFAADELFAPGSTVLLPKARRVAKEIGELLRSMPVDVVVEAHTDPLFYKVTLHPDPTTMSWHMALDLSQLLIDKTGWPAARIGIAAYGDTRPVADNGTSRGRARNRRIELLVVPMGKKGGSGG